MGRIVDLAVKRLEESKREKHETASQAASENEAATNGSTILPGSAMRAPSPARMSPQDISMEEDRASKWLERDDGGRSQSSRQILEDEMAEDELVNEMSQELEKGTPSLGRSPGSRGHNKKNGKSPSRMPPTPERGMRPRGGDSESNATKASPPNAPQSPAETPGRLGIRVNRPQRRPQTSFLEMENSKPSKPVKEASVDPPVASRKAETPKATRKTDGTGGDATPKTRISTSRKERPSSRTRAKMERFRKRQQAKKSAPQNDDDTVSVDSYVPSEADHERKKSTMSKTLDTFVDYLNPPSFDEESYASSHYSKESEQGTTFSIFTQEKSRNKLMNEIQDMFMERMGCAEDSSEIRQRNSFGTCSSSFADDESRSAISVGTEQVDDRLETVDENTVLSGDQRIEQINTLKKKSSKPKPESLAQTSESKKKASQQISTSPLEQALDDILSPLGIKTCKALDTETVTSQETDNTGFMQTFEKLRDAAEAHRESLAKGEFKLSDISKQLFTPKEEDKTPETESRGTENDDKDATLLERFSVSVQSKTDDVGDSSIVTEHERSVASKYSPTSVADDSLMRDTESKDDASSILANVSETLTKFKDEHLSSVNSINSNKIMEDLQSALSGISVSQPFGMKSNKKDVLRMDIGDEIHESSIEQSIDDLTSVIKSSADKAFEADEITTAQSPEMDPFDIPAPSEPTQDALGRGVKEELKNTQEPKETEMNSEKQSKEEKAYSAECNAGVAKTPSKEVETESSNIEPVSVKTIAKPVSAKPVTRTNESLNKHDKRKKSKGKLSRLIKIVSPFKKKKKNKVKDEANEKLSLEENTTHDNGSILKKGESHVSLEKKQNPKKATDIVLVTVDDNPSSPSKQSQSEMIETAAVSRDATDFDFLISKRACDDDWDANVVDQEHEEQALDLERPVQVTVESTADIPETKTDEVNLSWSPDFDDWEDGEKPSSKDEFKTPEKKDDVSNFVDEEDWPEVTNLFPVDEKDKEQSSCLSPSHVADFPEGDTVASF